MADPVHAYARMAQLLRLAGALVVIAAGTAVVLALAGRPAGAATALEFAVPLGGAALLVAAVVFVRSRRIRQKQDPS